MALADTKGLVPVVMIPTFPSAEMVDERSWSGHPGASRRVR
jgi:hypothetical protein